MTQGKVKILHDDKDYFNNYEILVEWHDACEKN